MTGFGKSEVTLPTKKITIEIRSLNSKQLDMSIKMPAIYRPYEYEVRNAVSQRMQRGKVDVFISAEAIGTDTASSINREAFKAHYAAIAQICRENGIAESAETAAAIIQSVMRLPDVVSTDSIEVPESEHAALTVAVTEAIERLEAFRCQEGATLIADMLRRVDKIEALKEQVTPYEKARTETIRARILDGIAKIGVEADKNRLEQEMIFYIEKLDITEEKVRLANHCRYFRETAADEEAAGRKLGFIAQEMGREINTLGSKANDSEIQRLVVQLKDELEKIKEQVLNLL